jgi:hypothetical protein
MKTKGKSRQKSPVKAITLLKTKGNHPPVGKSAKLLKLNGATKVPEA